MKNNLLESYIENVRKWSQATLSDDSVAIRATVRHGKKADQIIKKLQATGRALEILNFLQDADPGVRLSVASHAIRFNIAPETAMPVFQSLLKDPSVPRVIRMMTRDGIHFLGLDKEKANN